MISEYGDDELELYELVRKLEYNVTKLTKKLCKKDCKRAAKVQAEEARKKYVEDYGEWEKRQVRQTLLSLTFWSIFLGVSCFHVLSRAVMCPRVLPEVIFG